MTTQPFENENQTPGNPSAVGVMPPPQQPGPSGDKKTMKTALIGAGVGAAVVVGGLLTVGAGAAAINAMSSDPRINDAYEACGSDVGADDYPGAAYTVGDDGKTLSIDTESEYNSDGTTALLCTWDSLGTSDSLQSRMKSTNSMMGQQTATEDGLTYAWSYHPKNGVNMMVNVDG